MTWNVSETRLFELNRKFRPYFAQGIMGRRNQVDSAAKYKTISITKKYIHFNCKVFRAFFTSVSSTSCQQTHFPKHILELRDVRTSGRVPLWMFPDQWNIWKYTYKYTCCEEKLVHALNLHWWLLIPKQGGSDSSVIKCVIAEIINSWEWERQI